METILMKGKDLNVRTVNGTCVIGTKSIRYRCKSNRYCCKSCYQSQEPQQIRASKKTAHSAKVTI